MSAVLTRDDIQPISDLLEKLLNVQRALNDLRDAVSDDTHSGDDFCVSVTQRAGVRDVSIANTHRLGFWTVLQGLVAMERELLTKLHAKDIDIESALPGQEGA